MAGQCQDLVTGLCVPEFDISVGAPGNQTPAVWAEGGHNHSLIEDGSLQRFVTPHARREFEESFAGCGIVDGTGQLTDFDKIVAIRAEPVIRMQKVPELAFETDLPTAGEVP